MMKFILSTLFSILLFDCFSQEQRLYDHPKSFVSTSGCPRYEIFDVSKVLYVSNDSTIVASCIQRSCITNNMEKLVCVLSVPYSYLHGNLIVVNKGSLYQMGEVVLQNNYFPILGNIDIDMKSIKLIGK